MPLKQLFDVPLNVLAVGPLMRERRGLDGTQRTIAEKLCFLLGAVAARAVAAEVVDVVARAGSATPRIKRCRALILAGSRGVGNL